VIRRLCGPNEGKDDMTDGRDVCNPLHYYKVPFTGIGISPFPRARGSWQGV
jgi:hypothetical protein